MKSVSGVVSITEENYFLGLCDQKFLPYTVLISRFIVLGFSIIVNPHQLITMIGDLLQLAGDVKKLQVCLCTFTKTINHWAAGVVTGCAIVENFLQAQVAISLTPFL
jgi:hypothetical protein